MHDSDPLCETPKKTKVRAIVRHACAFRSIPTTTPRATHDRAVKIDTQSEYPILRLRRSDHYSTVRRNNEAVDPTCKGVALTRDCFVFKVVYCYVARHLYFVESSLVLSIHVLL
jgi:hypothetical protein